MTFHRSRIGARSLLIGAGLLLLATRPVSAFNPQPDPPAFGVVSISGLETLRVTAACLPQTLTGEVVPGPCRVSLQLRAADGSVLKQQEAALQPGQWLTLEYSMGPTLGFAQRRLDVLPVAWGDGSGRVAATVQIVNSLTGLTETVLNAIPHLGTLGAAVPVVQ